jgi:hypothetical protein
MHAGTADASRPRRVENRVQRNGRGRCCPLGQAHDGRRAAYIYRVVGSTGRTVRRMSPPGSDPSGLLQST